MAVETLSPETAKEFAEFNGEQFFKELPAAVEGEKGTVRPMNT